MRFLDDIRDSATYKLVQELDRVQEGVPITEYQPVYQQSSTIKNLNRVFAKQGQL